MTFGEKLKDARKGIGYSQEELAEKLAVSRSAIAKWETDKGLPDINNLKMISQILNVSIDYLLDDGSKLDLAVVKKPINLADFSDKTINVRNKKKIKDKVVRSVYPKSEIYTLMADERMTKSEKIVDTAVWLLTPLVDVVKLSKQMNNLDKEYYLVNEDDKQYLVVVTEEYIESRTLTKKITEKKFEIGNYKFVNCGPIIEK